MLSKCGQLTPPPPLAWLAADLTDRKAWEKVKFWVNELLVHEPQCNIVLAGTKEDLLSDEHIDRGVEVHAVTKCVSCCLSFFFFVFKSANFTYPRYCSEVNGQFFETSSKTGLNVETVFRSIAENYIRQNPQGGSSLARTGRGKTVESCLIINITMQRTRKGPSARHPYSPRPRRAADTICRIAF